MQEDKAAEFAVSDSMPRPVSETPRISFADVLKSLRLQRRMTQRALAARANISVEAVSTLERGFRRIPQVDTLKLLSDALDLDGDDAVAFRRAALSEARPRLRPVSLRAEGLAGNLPAAAAKLLGRERDVTAVRRLLDRHRLVSIVGAGGIGKTQLALAIARGSREALAEGAWFVDLSPLASDASVLQQVAGILRFSGDVTASRLVTWLHGQSILFVFDNCEHVARDAGALLHALLAECPKLRVLVTSRRPLDVATEVTYRLPTLSVPDANEATSLGARDARQFSAISLFVERAEGANLTFTLTDHNASGVAQICRTLDGIALAIELAARRTRALSVAEILARLDRRFSLLTGGPNDSKRHRTLQSLFDWSYGLLSVKQRAFFDRLGVFPGSFTLEAARFVALDAPHDEYEALDRLQSLVDDSLVVREEPSAGDSGPTRYVLLETIKEYVRGHLGEATAADHERTHRSFLAYYHELFVSCSTAFAADPREEILTSVASEDVNRFAAIETARELGEYVLGAQLLTAVPSRYGNYRELIALTSQFADLVEPGEKALLSRLYSRNAYEQLQFSIELASDAVARAVSLSRESGDPSALGFALHISAHLDMVCGRLRSAGEALKEAKDISTGGAALSLQRFTEALLATYSGDRTIAADRFRKIFERERQLGNPNGQFDALRNLAEAEHADGHTERAIEAAHLAHALCPNISPGKQAHLFANYAGYLVAIGDFDRCRLFARHSLRCAQDNVAQAWAFQHLALADALEGNVIRAATLFGASTTIVAQSGGMADYTEKSTQEHLAKLFSTAPDEARLRTCIEAGANLTLQSALEFESSDSS